MGGGLVLGESRLHWESLGAAAWAQSRTFQPGFQPVDRSGGFC